MPTRTDRRRRRVVPGLAAGLGLATLLAAAPARAAATAAVADTLDVVATWAPLAPENLPQSRAVIDGETLRRRGATDLRSALALVAGVEAVPGGDGGPASAVPALWGLREFDAFLLVVDGVPWGGAFVPDLPTLDLNDVARIEVIRGPAPVTYGATSFVGVIAVDHRRPGDGQGRALLAGGSRGTVRAAAAADLGARVRLAVDGARRRFADPDAAADGGHARLRWDATRDILVDADVTVLHQAPASPVPRSGGVLDPALPRDGNQNPRDAKLDRTRLQFTARQGGRPVSWAVAVSRVEDDNIRGFLEEDAVDDGSSSNANGYTQSRELTEFYGRVFHRIAPGPRAGLTVGADGLFGKGEESSRNFRYYAPFDGSRPWSSAAGVPVEDTDFEAERTFLGAFAELDWHPARDWTVLAGMRLNHVAETREGEREEGGVPVQATVKAVRTRPGGRVGVSWRAWQSALDDVVLYANWRDTFKPAAVDFGPEAEVDPLEPETAGSLEAGARAGLAGDRLHLEASVFRLDMENLVVATRIDGLPALANAGKERFDGCEVDADWAFAAGWRARAGWAWHDATFRDYVQDFGGTPTQLAGNRLELAPAHLASAGLAWHDGRSHAEVLACYVGERFLDRRNSARAEAYATVDAAVGTRLGRVDVWLAGRNLGDRRDPVSESELGEGQYYRLHARSLEVGCAVGL